MGPSRPSASGRGATRRDRPGPEGASPLRVAFLSSSEAVPRLGRKFAIRRRQLARGVRSHAGPIADAPLVAEVLRPHREHRPDGLADRVPVGRIRLGGEERRVLIVGGADQSWRRVGGEPSRQDPAGRQPADDRRSWPIAPWMNRTRSFPILSSVYRPGVRPDRPWPSQADREQLESVSSRDPWPLRSPTRTSVCPGTSSMAGLRPLAGRVA